MTYYSLIHLKSTLDEKIIQRSIKTNLFYDVYYGNYNLSDKEKLQNFLRFIKNKLIVVYDAPSFIYMINNELSFWNLDEIPEERFRCVKGFFNEIVGKIDPYYKEKYNSLDKYYEYYGLEPGIKIHFEIFTDLYSFVGLIIQLYKRIDSNPL